MQLARIRHHDVVTVGIVRGEQVDLLRDAPEDLVALLQMPPHEHEDAAAWSVSDTVALAEVDLLLPVQPRALRDFVSFEKHVEGATRAVEGKGGVPEAWYEAPTFLFMNPHSAVGPDEDVEIPPGAQEMDFELEVGVVIGSDGRNLTPEQARDHIAGYLVCNDWSARDLQAREMRMGLGPAKGKDFATSLGPWVVTPDDLETHRNGDRLDLAMTVSVNGREIGGDRLANMAWSFEELIAYASRGAWVRAGDVILSGTCANGALAEFWGRAGRREPPPLQAGDEVAMTVEGLGTLRNRLVAGPPEASPIPAARRGVSP